MIGFLLAAAGASAGGCGSDATRTLSEVKTADAFIDVTRSAFTPPPLILVGWPALATFDYDNDGDIDIFLGNVRESLNLLYQNDGRGVFTYASHLAGLKLSEETIVAAGVGDFDNDGWLDLVLGSQPLLPSHRDQPSRTLFLKNKGPDAEGVVRFEDVTALSGLDRVSYGLSIGVGDLDNDGLLDLYIGRYNLHDLTFELAYYLPDTPSVLMHNTGVVDGVPVFEDITAAAGVAGTPVAGLAPDTAHIVNHVPTYAVYFTDVDGDGRQDLFALHEIPGFVDLFMNNGDLTFRPAHTGLLQKHGGWMGIAAGDFDRDGHLDYFLANVGADAKGPNDPLHIANAFKLPQGTPFHRLLKGDGQGGLIDVASQIPVTPGALPPSNILQGSGVAAYEFGFGCSWLDVENDGWLDLCWFGDIPLSGLVPDGPLRRDFHGVGRLLSSNGDGSFTDRTGPRGLFAWSDNQPLDFGYNRPGRALAAVDLNGDGYADLCRTYAFLIPRPEEAFCCLFNPAHGAGHWMIVRLEGTASNRFGIGARVEARAGGTPFVAEVVTTTSAFTAVHPQVHFGLGTNAVIEELTVRWPSGMVTRLADVAVDRILTVREEQGAGT